MGFSQKISPKILEKRWSAQWITVPNASSEGYGVYLFRKSFALTQKPNSFIIHVSADNRYKLYVNNKLVSLGPARADIAHWNFETIDIASFLVDGKNIIGAQVWNEGEHRPEAQTTYKTGFILQGGSDTESKLIDSNTQWKCLQDSSYAPLNFNVNTYYVAGPGEIRDFRLHPKGWSELEFNDAQWQKPKVLGSGTPKTLLGAYGSPNGWMLVPSAIPQMEYKDERLQTLISKSGNIDVFSGFPKVKSPILIPANTTVKLILDQSYLINAFSNLEFSSGKNATITLKYAEALYTKFPYKGNRNEVDGKVFLGRSDSLISDGSSHQKFLSLAYRTYRFIQINIITQNEPLTLDDVFGTFSGYPFQLNATLSTQSREIDDILEIGWRTARLCAYETYMDCPYYEQLQYVGDTRIQALVSLYNSGDDRLVKNALNLIDFSREPEGITFSRYPTYTPQYIPTFSLWYIGMLHDYARYGSDTGFVMAKMGGVRQILDYFKKYQMPDGSLKNVPQWMFTDWVENDRNWVAGVGPSSANGTSALIDLQLLWAFQVASDLEKKLGNATFANQYDNEILNLKKMIRSKYWDNNKKLFADREEKNVFSQHSNALAILTGIVSAQEAKSIAKQLLENKDLAPASIYFKYYIHQALIKTGLGNEYLSWLNIWRENMKLGLSTWSEISEVDKTRSDCHAWGSSPNIEFYRTTLGIDSDAFGFSKVKIEPHLGDLKDVAGSIPHPKGKITARYIKVNEKWNIQIDLPSAINGRFLWKGKSYPLKSGTNKFNL